MKRFIGAVNEGVGPRARPRAHRAHFGNIFFRRKKVNSGHAEELRTHLSLWTGVLVGFALPGFLLYPFI